MQGHELSEDRDVGRAHTVRAGPNQALTLCKLPLPRLQYSGSAMSLASSGICSKRGCCARYPNAGEDSAAEELSRSFPAPVNGALCVSSRLCR